MKSPLKITDICKSVNITKAQLYCWEKGKAEPRLHYIFSLCNVLNIPLEEFLFEDDASHDYSLQNTQLINNLAKASPDVRTKAIVLLNTFLFLMDKDPVSSFSGPIFDAASGSIVEIEERIKPGRPKQGLEYVNDEQSSDESPEDPEVTYSSSVTVENSDDAPPASAKPADAAKRGRPKKVSLAEDEAPQQQKKRGRQRKTPEPSQN